MLVELGVVVLSQQLSGVFYLALMPDDEVKQTLYTLDKFMVDGLNVLIHHEAQVDV